MKNWIQFILYLIAQLLIFRLIAVEYAKYKLREERQLNEKTVLKCDNSKWKLKLQQ